MKSPTPRTVFEAAEVAEFCGTDVATIYTWVKKGEIPHFKTPGGRLRFKREALLGFLRRYQFPIPPELLQGRPRVLLIDAESPTRTRARKLLGRVFDITAHDDVCDGLLAIGHDEPDAVVLGELPAPIEPTHCLARIRARDQLAHTRLVVFAPESADESALCEAGADAVVRKPDAEALHRKIRELLGT